MNNLQPALIIEISAILSLKIRPIRIGGAERVFAAILVRSEVMNKL